MLFRIATIGRYVHTLVYAVYPVPQPARGLSWLACYATTAYMAVVTLMTFA